MALGVALLTRLYLYDPSYLIADDAAFVKPKAQGDWMVVLLCQSAYVKRLNRLPWESFRGISRVFRMGSTPSFGFVTASAKGYDGVGVCGEESIEASFDVSSALKQKRQLIGDDHNITFQARDLKLFLTFVDLLTRVVPFRN